MADVYVDDDRDRRRLINGRYVDYTFLSRRLRAVAGRRMIGRRLGNIVEYRWRFLVGGPRPVRRCEYNFSWVTPWHHGLKIWEYMENPVPAPVDQGDLELCIPYATYNILRMQVNIMVKFAPPGVVVPQVSLPYLIYAFNSMPEDERNLGRFLIKLHYEGFLTTEHYHEDGHMELNPRWYNIHFCKSISREGRTGLEFENDVRHSILYHGGVLAEIPVKSNGEIDPDGDVVGGVEVPALVKPDGTPVGHALLLLGWRVKNDIVKLLYQNSYGEGWGLEADYGSGLNGFGLVRSRDLHHVYVPQLKQWKVFSVTFHIGVSRTTTVLSNSAGC